MRLSSHTSITLRLTLFFASASSIVLLSLGFLIGASVEQYFEAQDTRSIMRAHGGDAFVRSDQTSTVFELTVPGQLGEMASLGT